MLKRDQPDYKPLWLGNSQLLECLREATTDGPDQKHQDGKQQHRFPTQHITQTSKYEQKARVR